MVLKGVLYCEKKIKDERLALRGYLCRSSTSDGKAVRATCHWKFKSQPLPRCKQGVDASDDTWQFARCSLERDSYLISRDEFLLLQQAFSRSHQHDYFIVHAFDHRRRKTQWQLPLGSLSQCLHQQGILRSYCHAKQEASAPLRHPGHLATRVTGE
ncbi:hypothetical protein F5Y18DRAFT_173646 [Xylariaceae sp. FL1019]|nr:hypothetical protein F5Y18DRAFT_173646 [Xylariaceae sp. FL1019]